MSSTIRGSDSFDSARAAALKAWVNFNGTGTVSITGAMNVSSITDQGVGSYYINFTTPMVDGAYCATGMGGKATQDVGYCRFSGGTHNPAYCHFTTLNNYGNAYIDVELVNVAFFR